MICGECLPAAGAGFQPGRSTSSASTGKRAAEAGGCCTRHSGPDSRWQLYGAERTPEVFLFDESGALRYHGAIDDNYDNPNAVQSHYLREALDAVLAGQTPPTAQTPPVGCTIKWK